MDDSPFLRAILEDPLDDGPRLVWADALDERGDPRGEFVRVQCKLARWPCECDTSEERVYHDECRCKERAELRRRERELIPRAWWAWCCPDFLQGRQWSVCRDQSEITVYATAGPPEVELTCRIRRGLVGSVTLTCRQFFGGPCEQCEGTNCPYCGGPERDYHTACTPCPACRDPETGESAGRTKGVAAELFRAAPIAEVRLSDREPDAIGNGRLAWWYTDPDWHRPGLHQHHWLPVELRPYLAGRISGLVDEPRPGVCGFDYGDLTEGTDGVELARADCSAACVKFGRARANLPALAPVAVPAPGA